MPDFSPSPRLLTRLCHALGGAVVAALAWVPMGCAPTVNIATPEPVVIDVNIKADVTTRSADAAEKKKAEPDYSGLGSPGADGGSTEPQKRPGGGGE